MSAVSELVEQLRGQAVELREGAKGRRAGNVLGLRLQNDIAEQHASLADLIDGTLQEHWETRERYNGEMVPACGRCSHGDGVAWRAPCQSLARHVSAVLSGYTQTAQEGR